MAEMTDDEMNRACAEKLGLRLFDEIWHAPECDCGRDGAIQRDGECICPTTDVCPESLPDFLHGPAANEMLLEAMKKERHVAIICGQCENDTAVILLRGCAAPFPLRDLVDHPGYWKGSIRVQDPDRKRAIVLAFLAS